MKRGNRSGLVGGFGGVAIWAATMVGAAMTSASTAAVSAEIRVFVSGAPGQAVKHVGASFAQSSGHVVSVTAETVAAIRDRLARGEKADLVVLPVAAFNIIDKPGVLYPGSRIDLARVAIGVAVRAGARQPDISTPNAVRQMLLDARSIVYPDPVGGGQTGAHIAQVIAQLGIADAVKAKTTLLYAIGGGVEMVAQGKAEVGMFNISEILPVKGVTLVGPLPAEQQSYITFAAAVQNASAVREPALALLHSLADAHSDTVWRESGLEPLHR